MKKNSCFEFNDIWLWEVFWCLHLTWFPNSPILFVNVSLFFLMPVSVSLETPSCFFFVCSHFGKFVEIHFKGSGEISGTAVRSIPIGIVKCSWKGI